MSGDAGRDRRKPTGRVGSKARSALAELAELRRTGGKRADRYEIREEEAVYDVVDEQEYEEIVHKRRKEGGFVVDRNDLGYGDTGEEVDWADGGATEVPQSVKKAKTGSRAPEATGASGSYGTGSGTKAAAKAPSAPADRFRMQRMFQSAAARGASRAPAPSPTPTADALLENILMDLGEDGDGRAGSARPAARPVPRSVGGVRGGRDGAERGAAPRVGDATTDARDALPSPAVPGVVKAEPTSPGPRSVKAEPASPGPRAFKAEPASPGPRAFRTEPVPPGPHAVKAGPPADDGEPWPMDEEAPATSLGHTGPRTGAVGAASVPAPALEDEPVAAGVAASAAWAEAADLAAVEAEGAAAREAEMAAASLDRSAELPLDAEGRLPFFLLDAHEEPAAPGQAFLFGKIPLPSAGVGGEGGRLRYASACAVVAGLERNAYFVPRAPVGGPELEALASEAVADPGKKGALMRALHASLDGVKAEAREALARSGIRTFVLKPVQRRYAFEDPLVPFGLQWVIKCRFPAELGTISRSALAALGIGEAGARRLGGSPPSATAQVLGANGSPLEALVLKRRIMGPGWLTLRDPAPVLRSAQVSWCDLEIRVSGHKNVSVAVGPEATREAPPLAVASVRLQTRGGVASAKSVAARGARAAGAAAPAPAVDGSEIVAASVVFARAVPTDRAVAPEELSRPGFLGHFSIVSRLDGAPHPPGLDARARGGAAGVPPGAIEGDAAAPRAGPAALTTVPNERALLASLLGRLKDLDVDAVVGHNLAAYDLPLLISRASQARLPTWSSLGRLRRSRPPSLAGGGHQHGGGASPGVVQATAGRLACDTYLVAREHVREVDYTLRTLSRSLLGAEREDPVPARGGLEAAFSDAASLAAMVGRLETDAWLSLRLANALEALPLSKALAALTGSSWSRALLGARARRIESLLCHEFYARKFMLPDRFPAGDGKGGAGGAPGPRAGAGADAHAVAPSGSGPAYAGGLVLEPKRGLYEKYVLLLDFNSLYPSIIQEYDICFTTVERRRGGDEAAGGKGATTGDAAGGRDGAPDPPSTALTDTAGAEAPAAASGAAAGPAASAVLPKVLHSLVRRRQAIKAMVKTERDATKARALRIREKALKLTANSLYGCLGFSSSRFYAKALAELVTARGREVLASSAEAVRNALGGLAPPGSDVVYGDTDSLMIATGLEGVAPVLALGNALKREINRRYRCLQIDIDGIFKRLLLLKKKKYAALKVELDGDKVATAAAVAARAMGWNTRSAGGGGGPAPTATELAAALPPSASDEALVLRECVEAKGLDLVRRDWSPLARETGSKALDVILSGVAAEEAAEAVCRLLADVGAAVRAGRVPLHRFVVTKALTKAPTDYPDAMHQPHVLVALRRLRAGKRDGVAAGETVPYIACVRVERVGGPAESGAGAAHRAAGSSAQVADAPGVSQGASQGASEAAGEAAGEEFRVVESSRSLPLAERCFHPEEVRESGGLLRPDADYYLASQILPVVSRLCEPIDGAGQQRLASALGLDGSKYRRGGGTAGSGLAGADDPSERDDPALAASILDDPARFARCDRLVVELAPGPGPGSRARLAAEEGNAGGPSEASDGPLADAAPAATAAAALTFDRAAMEELAAAAADAQKTDAQIREAALRAVGGGEGALDGTAAPTPGQLANVVRLRARRAVQRYYAARLASDDEAAPWTGRDLSLRPPGAPGAPLGAAHPDASAAGASVRRLVTEGGLYGELRGLQRCVDPEDAASSAIGADKRALEAVRQRLARLAPELGAAASVARAFARRSSYGYVSLGDLFGVMPGT